MLQLPKATITMYEHHTGRLNCVQHPWTAQSKRQKGLHPESSRSIDGKPTRRI